MANNKEQINYCCKYCSFRFKSRICSRTEEHTIECRKKYEHLVEGVDYIICRICNFHGVSLGQHIARLHKNISLKDYRNKYGKLISNSSTIKYSKSTASRLNWIEIAKANGKDLTEKFKEIGIAVSKSIMNNPKERKRRSELVTELHKTVLNDPKLRIIYSETAKKTSARPEILAQRTENLRKWRENFPEDFQEKCVKPFKIAAEKVRANGPTWFSKPEKMLFAFISNLSGFNFRFNQCIKSNLFDWPSKRKQIDMGDKLKRIYIEYDGPFHFPFRKGGNPEKFADVLKKDKLLEQYIIDNNFMLIRISMDQFHDSKTNSYFKKECLDKLIKILYSNIPGIYKIGERYGEHK